MSSLPSRRLTVPRGTVTSRRPYAFPRKRKDATYAFTSGCHVCVARRFARVCSARASRPPMARMSAGYISGEFEGETRRVRFIRADQSGSKQVAIDHSVSKARQIIDEKGVKLLGQSHL